MQKNKATNSLLNFKAPNTKAQRNAHTFGLRLTFHGIGISCLAGAVFLQVLVFSGIASQGFFMGIEQNPFILTTEVAMTIFCIIYFIYLSVTKLKTFLNPK